MTAALHLDTVSIRFGGVIAVDHVTCSISVGEFVGLIGPNGAGKTTLIRIIAGVLAPDSGRILVSGLDVTRLPTAKRVRNGLAMTHQIVRPFRSMTVLENVTLAAGHRITANPLRALSRWDRGKEEERSREVLASVGLKGAELKPVLALPLGELKRLEVARALAVDPSVILLDEPLAGLNRTEAALQMDVIASINARGVTTIVVEHNLAEIVRTCPRVIVLDQGRIIADGPPTTVIADAAVREAYLGMEASHAAA
jgi:branched-chain amino acid transport system ATP-binding protein